MTWSYYDVFFEFTQQVCCWLRPFFSSHIEGEWTQIFHGEYRRGIRSSQSEVSPFAWRNFMAYWATRPLCGNNCFPWWVLCQTNFLNHLNPTDIVTKIEAGDQAVCKFSRVWRSVWIVIPLEETNWYFMFMIYFMLLGRWQYITSSLADLHFGTNCCGHERKSFRNRNLKMVVWQLGSTCQLWYTEMLW